MASARTCETCGLEVPPGAGVCPRDGTVLHMTFSVRDDEDTQVEAAGDPWAREPPARGGNSSPFAWGEEPPPRSHQPVSQDGNGVMHSNPWGEEPPTRDPLISMKLGEYELRSRIGVGGMGFVYDGIQPLIGKRVAVKVLRPELAQAPEQVARLLAEARAVNAIRHRGIIDIFGFGQVPDGRQYIVMEFLDGQPLDAYMAEKGRLPPTEALSILDEVLAALGAAHGAGVVHRDLKPSNIFLVKEPGGSRYVKLLDFGLAKQGQGGATGRTAQTRTDMVVGTPEYMAPEQARGQAVGPMTDLYAMGVVTFEMVTGRLPFIGTSPVDLLMKHVDARPPRPSEFVHELPPALDAFILQMLTKDPEARPGSADALRQQLHRLRRTMLRPTRTQSSSNGAALPGKAPTPAAPVPAPVPSPSTEPGAAIHIPLESAAATPAVSEPTTAPNEAVKVERLEKPAKVEDAASRSTTQVAMPQEITPEEARLAGVRSPMRRFWPIGLGIAALLAAGGVMLLRNGTTTTVVTPPPTPTPTPVTNEVPQPPAPNPAVTPPVPAPTPPAPTPTPPAPTVTPPVAANPVTPPTETTKPPEPQPHVVKPTPKPNPSQSGVPSQAVLLAIIEGLQRDVNARAARGQDMTIARSQLERLRKEANDARDTSSRRSVATKIDFWERNYLKRN
jgi:serine/threonine protein kinase